MRKVHLSRHSQPAAGAENFEVFWYFRSWVELITYEDFAPKVVLIITFFSVHPTDDIWHSKTVIYYSLCENDHRLSDYNGDDSSSPMSDWVVNVNDLWWKNMNMCKYKSSPGYQISVFFVWKSSRMRTENSLFLVNNNQKTPEGRDFFLMFLVGILGFWIRKNSLKSTLT